jgi:serine/threonine protein phosphatase PrpC
VHEKVQAVLSSVEGPVTSHDYERVMLDIERACDLEPNSVAKMLIRTTGSLSVTRALGDAYLKVPQLAPEHLRDKVPYIHASPSVSIVRRDPNKRTLLILASDGIWDWFDQDTMTETVLSMESDLYNGAPFSICQTIIQDCLASAADSSAMSFEHLNKMTMGRSRRALHDDMTLVILWLGHAPKMVVSQVGKWMSARVENAP